MFRKTTVQVQPVKKLDGVASRCGATNVDTDR